VLLLRFLILCFIKMIKNAEKAGSIHVIQSSTKKIQ